MYKLRGSSEHMLGVDLSAHADLVVLNSGHLINLLHVIAGQLRWLTDSSLHVLIVERDGINTICNEPLYLNNYSGCPGLCWFSKYSNIPYKEVFWCLAFLLYSCPCCNYTWLVVKRKVRSQAIRKSFGGHRWQHLGDISVAGQPIVWVWSQAEECIQSYLVLGPLCWLWFLG